MGHANSSATRAHGNDDSLQQVLKDYELPSFSAVVMAALEKIRDHNCAADEIGTLLESDPGVTVKLLSLANSACYGLKSTVGSAAHAVTLLGRNQVESLLLAVGLGAALPRNPVPELDSSRFWCGAARRAATARRLSRLIDPGHDSESFTGALLQDMGVPLLAQKHPGQYAAILETWRAGEVDLVAAEQRLFGYDHAMVGSWMCQEWRISELIIRAIGAHHGVWDETDLPAVTLVSVLTDEDESFGGDALVEACGQRFGLSPDVVTQLLDEATIDAAEIARMFA